jgi:hypothetical protein
MEIGAPAVMMCVCKEDDPTVCESCHQWYVETVLTEVQDASFADAIRWPWLEEVAS